MKYYNLYLESSMRSQWTWEKLVLLSIAVANYRDKKIAEEAQKEIDRLYVERFGITCG